MTTQKNIAGIDVVRAFQIDAPKLPGVYRMFDADDKVLYVGKAKNLFNRIKNYTDFARLSDRIRMMVSQTARMEIITTTTENEALLLEQDLIKTLAPKYNILMRDDKSYPYMTISKDDFPRIGKFRGTKNSRMKFFGPFPSGLALNESIKIIQSMFKIRTCANTMFKNRMRPCMLYQIKKCSAPCCGLISNEDYSHSVRDAENFLRGRNSGLLTELSSRMERAAATRDYETAIALRDQIASLNQMLKKSPLAGIDFDTDIIAIAEESGEFAIEVLFSRANAASGSFSFTPTNAKGATRDEVAAEFIDSFYTKHEIPRAILLNVAGDFSGQSETLSESRGARVEIITPQQGEKKRAVEIVERNARDKLTRRLVYSSNQKKYLESLAALFNLATTPKRIDIFDNSHIMGTAKVGAMVVATPDGFSKKDYRKYDIKNANANDDTAMMDEVLTRRYTRAKADGTLPDLIILDGGKGQLDAAWHALRRLDLSLPVVGMAKTEGHDAGGETLLMLSHAPIKLDRADPLLFYLERLRDEAHRFVITAHRKKRAANEFSSELDSIEGIGAAKKKALLNYFGSVKNIINADADELTRVDGISSALAKKIYEDLH